MTRWVCPYGHEMEPADDLGWMHVQGWGGCRSSDSTDADTWPPRGTCGDLARRLPLEV